MPSVLCGRRMQIAAALFAALVCRGALAQTVFRPPQTNASASKEEGLEFSLSAGVNTSDNVKRVPVDEENGTIESAGVTLGYQAHTRRLDANVDIDAMYDHYLDDTVDDDVVGGLDAQLGVAIVPERFTWTAADNFGQLTTDPFAADTPNNRENINYFTTGPQFVQRLGSSMSLVLSGRFSDTQYEISNLDSRETGGSLSLTRQLAGAGELSIVGDVSSTKFDDQVANTDYDRSEVYLRYSLQGARTILGLEGGATSLDIGGNSSSGALAEINVTRVLSNAARLSFGAGSQFSNSGDLFREGQNTFGVDPAVSNVSGSGDPFQRRFVRLGFDFDRNRTSLGVNAVSREESYETQTSLDRRVTTWSAYARRRLGPTLQLALFGTLEQEKFDNIDYDEDELRAGAYLDWTFARTLSLRLQYQHFDRDTNTGTSDYKENQASLFLTWSPVQRR